MGQAEPDSSTGVANVAQPTDCGCNSDSDADCDCVCDCDGDCDCEVDCNGRRSLICNAAVVAMHKSFSYLWHEKRTGSGTAPAATGSWQMGNEPLGNMASLTMSICQQEAVGSRQQAAGGAWSQIPEGATRHVSCQDIESKREEGSRQYC